METQKSRGRSRKTTGKVPADFSVTENSEKGESSSQTASEKPQPKRERKSSAGSAPKRVKKKSVETESKDGEGKSSQAALETIESLPAAQTKEEGTSQVEQSSESTSLDSQSSENKEIIAPEIQTNSVEKEAVEEIGISEEIINEKIQTVIELQKPKKRKRSMIINIILLIVNLILMFFIVKNLFVNLEDTSLRGLFSQRGNKMWWLVGGVAMYGFYILVQVLIFKTLIKRLSGRKSWKIAYDAAIVGKYYDNITPFAVGGQGMQILSLVQNGIGAGVATSIPILKMMINSGINALLALLFFVFGIPFIPKTSILNDFLILLLEILGVIGLIITVLIALFILLISSGTLITRSLISGVLRLGYKLKIIKDYRTTYKKVMNQVTEYKFSMSYLWKHKKTLLELVFLSILECLSYASLAFFVAMAFTDSLGGSIYLFIFVCIAKYYLCAMASCYIPLPGGTGLMEISFILLFGMTIGSNIVWALIFWRFLTYYLIIIHGFTHELCKIIKTFASSRKKKIA